MEVLNLVVFIFILIIVIVLFIPQFKKIQLNIKRKKPFDFKK